MKPTAKQISSAPFAVEVREGQQLESWLIHPNRPISGRIARKVLPSFGFAEIAAGKKPSKEALEAAFERKYKDWDERKDFAYLLGEGYDRLVCANIVSSERSDSASVLHSASLTIDYDDGRANEFRLLDALAPNQFRQNQIVMPFGRIPMRGARLRLSTGLPPASGPVSLQLILALEKE